MYPVSPVYSVCQKVFPLNVAKVNVFIQMSVLASLRNIISGRVQELHQDFLGRGVSAKMLKLLTLGRGWLGWPEIILFVSNNFSTHHLLSDYEFEMIDFRVL